MFIVHQNCDSELANDRTLPYNSYIVEYNDGTNKCYDIVITDKKVDIFDYYWDRYREDLIGFKQTEGRVNPKLWDGNKKQTKKKR